MEVKVVGSLSFTNLDGTVTQFEIEDLKSLYSVTNSIVRSINMFGPIDDFITECVEITKVNTDMETGKDLAAAFREWAERNGHRFDAGRNALYKQIGHEHGVRRVEGGNKVAFRGLRLRPKVKGEPVAAKTSASSEDDLI